jgi:hypothetical protein
MDDGVNEFRNRNVQQSSDWMRRSSIMFSNKRFVSAIVGVILMALPASALAADHHWDHWGHWNHQGHSFHHPAYATPPIAYGYPPARYPAPQPGYAAPYAYQTTPYVAPYTSPYAGANNLGNLMAKRQQAYDGILAANRTGNKGGAHRMWELYNGYNQRIAAQGGSTLPY